MLNHCKVLPSGFVRKGIVSVFVSFSSFSVPTDGCRKFLCKTKKITRTRAEWTCLSCLQAAFYCVAAGQALTVVTNTTTATPGSEMRGRSRRKCVVNYKEPHLNRWGDILSRFSSKGKLQAHICIFITQKPNCSTHLQRSIQFIGKKCQEMCIYE